MFSQPAPASAGSPTCRPSVPGSGSGPSSVRSLSPDALRLTNLHVDPDNRHRRPAFRRHHDVSDFDPGLSTHAHRSLGKQCARQPERGHGRVWRWSGKRSWPYLAATILPERNLGGEMVRFPLPRSQRRGHPAVVLASLREPVARRSPTVIPYGKKPKSGQMVRKCAQGTARVDTPRQGQNFKRIACAAKRRR